MTLFTIKGRIQTKLVTYIILALITLVFSWLSPDVNFWPLFALMIPVGLVLEAMWGAVISFQAGWMTFFIGILEFTAVAACMYAIKLPISFGLALVYYCTSWALIQLFLLYLMPVLKMSWGEDAGELW